MTATVPEAPRQGQYLPAYVYVRDEGGGDLHVNAVACDECSALVDEPNLDRHMNSLHAAASPPGGTDPKMR